jgi:hypothetical protein
MAVILAALSLWQLLFPERFYSVFASFKRAYAGLSPEQSPRLQRVLGARYDAEDVSPTPTRYTGLFGIVMAALEFVPSIPFVRRSPLDAFSPVLMAALAGWFAGVAIIAGDASFRLGALAVGASMLLLGWIAWRVAGSQALVFGNDPQLEYAVDERLRVSRTAGIGALACAPAVVLVGWCASWVGATYQMAATAALVLTYASFVVAMIVCGLATRRLSNQLVTGANG